MKRIAWICWISLSIIAAGAPSLAAGKPALTPEAGSEQYAPLARAIIGGSTLSVMGTVFLVPAAYLLIHRGEEPEEARA